MLYKIKQRLFGSGKYCPVCEKEVERFEPLPQIYFDMARQHGYLYSFDDSETMNYREYECPSCHCSDRDRLYALYLKRFFSPSSPGGKATFIDFAPIPALSSFIKRSFADLNYRTADLMADNVDDKVDITDMKIYADNSVGFFICSHVLEHVSDGKKAMRELFRILKPGGKGIAMVPILLSITETQEDPSVTSPEERLKYYGQEDHVRLYSRQGFMRDLKEAGFTITEYDVNRFGSDVFKRCGISPKSVLYIVAK